MEEQIKQVAARIKDLREILNISPEAAADYCGLTVADYCEIESGKVDIPVGIMHLLARKFNVDVTTFLSGAEPRMHYYTLTRKGKGVSVQRRKAYSYEALATNFINRKADPFIVTVDPKPDKAGMEFNSHPGQEFNLILKGSLLICLNNKEMLLNEGDSIFNPADMLDVIAKYKVTSFCAPPTIFRFMIREDFSKYDLSALEYCTTAGEALNPKVFETFRELTGIKLMEAFGQTETAVQLATFPWMEPKPGSMGIPTPQYNIDLLKPDGTSCEDGEEGQIVIRIGEHPPVGLFKGYFRDEERTREVLQNGVYYTGDIAWRDEDGYYWFVGRADDVIKSSGYRIGPFEVESVLMTHPAVVECAVTGVPDDIRGQVVKATIVPAPGYVASEKLIREIQEHVKQATAPYKYPRIIEFVEELPKTISGKIRRVEIRGEGKRLASK